MDREEEKGLVPTGQTIMGMPVMLKPSMPDSEFNIVLGDFSQYIKWREVEDTLLFCELRRALDVYIETEFKRQMEGDGDPDKLNIGILGTGKET